MKRNIALLALFFITASTYCMDPDVELGAKFLVGLRNGIHQTPQETKKSNEEFFRAGQCPSCGKIFFNKGEPHRGNTRRHFLDVCNKKRNLS